MTEYLNKGKKQFTEAEKKAFHMGRAYATAKAGKRVKLPDEKTKKSFRNGVERVRKKGSNKKADKPHTQSTCKNNGSSPLFLVNGDGEILKVYGGEKK